MTHSFKSLLLILSLVVIYSCGQNTTSTETTTTATTQAPVQVHQDSAAPQSITMNTFNKFPIEISGCACYFSRDVQGFLDGANIFVGNYENLGFVQINGVMTKFTLVDTKKESEKHVIKKYENEAFELIMDIQETGHIDKTWQNKGTIKLTKKGGKTIIQDIFGECRC
jgi:hypothetical protein